MSGFTSQPDEAVDRWLADQRRAVVDDLAATLDLEAGLREAMIPARHADLVADLRDVLDVEAGLSAILPATPAGSPEADPEQAPPDPQLPTDLQGLIRAITSASPTSRLAMRIRPTPILDRALDRAHDDVLALDRALDRARVFGRALARDLARVLARDLDLDRALDRARVFDSALARDLDLARDRVLDRVLVFARVLARALARDLGCVLDRARLSGLDDGLDLDRILVLDRARVFAYDLDRALGEIYRALSDFTGADLRNADLGGVSLEGLRWSVTTQWPPDWVEQIVRDSVEVEPGIFEVRGGTTHVPTTV